jgi:hypothetical protein
MSLKRRQAWEVSFRATGDAAGGSPSLFSLPERHTLLREDTAVQSFRAQLTDLQRHTLDLLGVLERAFLA